jgi:hypothetical protein
MSARALHAIGSELATATAFANPMSPIGSSRHLAAQQNLVAIGA